MIRMADEITDIENIRPTIKYFRILVNKDVLSRIQIIKGRA